MISTIIHTLFLDGGDLPAHYPPGVVHNIESWKQVYPQAEQHLFSLNAARDYLRAHFDQETCDAFDGLAPYAYKSDLFRYCFLLRNGGLYADISLRALRPIPMLNALVLFKTTTEITPWGMWQGLIFAQPGRPELQRTIDRIKQNVRNRDYGHSNLDVTGPAVFGLVVAQCGNNTDYVTGEFRAITPGCNGGNNVLLMNNELFAAQLKDQAGDISHLGITGANNYIEMWLNGVVFGEDHLRRWVFPHGISPVEGYYADGRIHFVPGVIGPQTRGPWFHADAGDYIVRLIFGEEGPSGTLGVAVTVGGGSNTLKHVEFPDGNLTGNRVEIPVHMDQPVSDAEVILLNPAGTLQGSLIAIELEKMTAE